MASEIITKLFNELVAPPTSTRRGTALRRRAIILAALVAIVGASVATPAAAQPRASATISAHMAATTVRAGQIASVIGKVAPRATSRVVVQRGVHGVWTDRQGGPVAADGSFRVDLRPSQTGVYALRVRSSGGSLVSPTVYLKVIPPDFSGFADEWGGHHLSATIDRAGHGHFEYADTDLCPTCALAYTPMTRVNFVLTSRSGKVAAGRVTSSTRPSLYPAGLKVTAKLTPGDPDGVILELTAGTFDWAFCNESSAGQCGA